MEKKGYDNKALKDYSKAIKINPKYIDAYFNRGLIWDKHEKYDHAVKDYTNVIFLNPKDAEAYINRGAIYLCGRARSCNSTGEKPVPEGKPATGQQVLGGFLVTGSFKRRTTSRQAVSQKVEGIELRNCRVGKDDTLSMVEVNTGNTVKGKEVTASPGFETMACLTL